MRDITYTPKQKGKVPLIAVTACTVVLVVCAVMMMLGIGKDLIWQALFLVAAGVLTFFYVRYFSITYTYTISLEHHTFLVVQQKGRRLTTLCNLDLAGLYLVRPYTIADDDSASQENRYSYCASFRPQESALLFFDDGERKVSVRVETDEFFMEQLLAVAGQNTYLEE